MLYRKHSERVMQVTEPLTDDQIEAEWETIKRIVALRTTQVQGLMKMLRAHSDRLASIQKVYREMAEGTKYLEAADGRPEGFWVPLTLLRLEEEIVRPVE